MKKSDDNKTLNLPTKRGRGRPPKEDALTPAERAKRYRDAKRAAKGTPSEADIKRDAQVTKKSIENGITMERAAELQKKYDLEHLLRLSHEAKIAELVQELAKPKRNPLAAKVRALTKELKVQEELITALKIENDALRAKRPSRK
jgi:hypothetical protein